MREIFLFVSSTKTCVSKAVRFFTRSKTTHTGLCLTGKFDNMYSFGRKTLKLFPAGLVHENLRTNMLKVQENCYCEAYSFKISEESYQNLLRVIEKYESEKEKYKFAVLGAWLCLFRIKMTFKYKRFCSQFVAILLSEGAGIKLPHHPSKMRPKDFVKMDVFTRVFSGSIKELAQKIDSGELVLKK